MKAKAMHSLESSENKPAKSGFPKAHWGLAFLLLLAVFYVHGGWPAPDDNEAHYLAKAKHYWDGQWGAGDFFLSSNDAHLVFYWTIGWWTRLLSLPAVAWLGRLVAWSLIGWAWLRLCRAMKLPPLAGVLAGGLFITMLARLQMAGEWVVGGVEAKAFAYGFVLLGIEALVSRRWMAVWILLGVASAFHVVVGGWCVVCAAACWLFAGRDRTPLKAMWPALAAGGAISLLGLVPGLLLTARTSVETAREANEIYVFTRLAHHLSIFDFGPLKLSRFAGLVAVFIILCFAVARFVDSGDVRRGAATIRCFVFSALVISGCGLIVSILWRNHPALAARFLRFYWYRLSDVAVPLGVALFVTLLLLRVLENRPKWGAALLTVLLGVTCWHLGETTWTRWRGPVPRADRKLCGAGSSPQSLRRYGDWVDVCRWITRDTPTDACFLTPRNALTFHWRAQRNQVVCWKDIPQDAPGLVEWKRRMDAVYTTIGEDGRRQGVSLGERGSDELIELGKQFGADYVLARRSPRIRLPEVYANGSFAVYRLERP